MTNNNIKPITNPLYLISQGFLPVREREIESILSIGNGYIGTRNSLEEHYIQCDAATFAAGIYEPVINSDNNALVKIPDWTRIQIYIDDTMANLTKQKYLEHIRYIDLNNGLYVRNWKNVDDIGRITNINITKFISLNNKNIAYKSLTITPENYSGKIKVVSGIDGSLTDMDYLIPESSHANNNITLAMRSKATRKIIAITQQSQFLYENQEIEKQSGFFEFKNKNQDKIVVEQWQWNAIVDIPYQINSVISIFTSNDDNDPINASKKLFCIDNSKIYKNFLDSHVQKFQSRWETSQICILNDINAQTWINFASYHLISAAEFCGNTTSIPARGLTGEAYQGHVFWDTEIYLLPFYIFTCPDIAKNLLMYRYNTLDAARANAIKEGFLGANYPWESTDTGAEMAPNEVNLPNGETIPIYSGKYENHITPDIAYAVWQYWVVTHDEDFLINYGVEILFETARFCRSMLKKGNDDLYHINTVIGPDEYHEMINDNAYTNIMVQHNLEIAVKACDLLKTINNEKFESLKNKINLSNSEIEEWKSTKDKIYTGCDPETKLFEQFKGFFDLEYINLHDYEPRTAPMDVILGKERTQQAQVIKQADVIMFLFLLPDKFSMDLIETNYGYYEPRTGHGSSLSPSIFSVMAARLGKTKIAYDYFAQNAKIDLKDRMGNASGGIHLASQGGSWLAVSMGFAGMNAYEQGLLFDPHLPDHWEKLEFSVNWRACKINIECFHKKIFLNISGKNNINISIGADNWKDLCPNKSYLIIKNEKWDWQ